MLLCAGGRSSVYVTGYISTGAVPSMPVSRGFSFLLLCADAPLHVCHLYHYYMYHFLYHCAYPMHFLLHLCHMLPILAYALPLLCPLTIALAAVCVFSFMGLFKPLFFCSNQNTTALAAVRVCVHRQRVASRAGGAAGTGLWCAACGQPAPQGPASTPF